MSGKRWAALILAIGLFLVSSVHQLSQNTGADREVDLFSDTYFETKVIREGSLGSPRIVVLNVEGVIQDVGDVPFLSSLAYNHRQFIKMIEQAGKDDTVDGIILKVNSPGGGVVESAEIYDKLAEVREKYGKPIYVSMGNMAASGGYYISAPADKILAHPATITGSIGVIMQSMDFSELAEDLGIDVNTLTSGEYKDIMSATRPMREDERELLQEIVDDMYDDFVQVVVEGRGMSEAQVRDLADGRIYTGKQAFDLNLIDGLGSFDDTVALMEQDHDWSEAELVEYRLGYGLGQLFNLSVKNFFKEEHELLGLLNIMRDSSGPRVMYLYSR